jgi:ABC-type Na+ efflux pump permease subunit
VNLRNINAIYRKDLIDAIRDARVLLALIMPFGIALVYNFVFDDEEPVPEGTVAHTEVGSELPDRLQTALAGTVRLELEPYDSPGDVHQVIEDEDAAIGLIIPEGFDQSLEAGKTPEIEVLVPESPGLTASIVASVIDPILRDIAGIPEPAVISQEFVSPEGGAGPNLFDNLGMRLYFVLAALMMLIAMIGVLAVPIILAEEAEKKTLEALTLIASYLDVVLAKALVGLTYLGIGTSLLLALTQTWPEDPVTFFSGILLLGITLVGFGLLLGGLFRSANQLNNWGGLILLPVIAPAFLIGVWSPGAFQYVLEAIPVSQGMKLAVNGMSGEAIFTGIWTAYAILAFWTVIIYTALVFRLSRLRS